MLERFTNTDKHRLIHAAVTNLIDAPAINFSRVIPVAVTEASGHGDPPDVVDERGPPESS